MRHASTVRSTLGFLRSLVTRRLRFFADSGNIADVYNYLPLPGLYTTSGQPSAAQMSLIMDEGYETVINLAPSSRFENSVINEAELLAGLGLNYVHIPVDFQNPSEKKFEQFVSALQEHEANKVWVHCAANMRVSAFTYRYRRDILREDEGLARADLEKIWQPLGVWKDFVS